MTDGESTACLQRALQVSHELLKLAEQGDMQAFAALGAERLVLLHSVKQGTAHIDANGQHLLQEISKLNDQAMGFMEHRLRAKGRDMEMASAGGRAISAYSATGR
jgi:hypothetical protein